MRYTNWVNTLIENAMKDELHEIRKIKRPSSCTKEEEKEIKKVVRETIEERIKDLTQMFDELGDTQDSRFKKFATESAIEAAQAYFVKKMDEHELIEAGIESAFGDFELYLIGDYPEPYQNSKNVAEFINRLMKYSRNRVSFGINNRLEKIVDQDEEKIKKALDGKLEEKFRDNYQHQTPNFYNKIASGLIENYNKDATEKLVAKAAEAFILGLAKGIRVKGMAFF